MRTKILCLTLVKFALFAFGQGFRLSDPAFLQSIGNLETPFIYYATAFDGSDYMQVLNNLSGIADGPAFTCSFWVNFHANTSQEIFSIMPAAGTERHVIGKNSSGNIYCAARATGSTTKMNFRGTTALTSASGWKHILICAQYVDVNTDHHIYINGVEEGSYTVSTWASGDIDWAPGVNTTNTVGAYYDGTLPLNADLCEFWWSNTYLNDPTKFASGGKPISLGTTGNLPTGTAPIIYLHNPYDSFQTDCSGRGNNFTVTGTLTSASAP